MNIHCGVQQHKAQKKRQIELFVCRTHLTLSCPRVKLYCSEVAAWSLFHSNIDFVLRVYSVLGRKRNKHYKNLMRDVWVYWDFWLLTETLVFWQIWNQFDAMFRSLCNSRGGTCEITGDFFSEETPEKKNTSAKFSICPPFKLINV